MKTVSNNRKCFNQIKVTILTWLKDTIEAKRYKHNRETLATYSDHVIYLQILTLDNFILLLKVVIVLICISVLCWQVRKCLDRYLQYDTTTTLSVKRTGDSTFVALTVCPAYESAYKDEVLNIYGSYRRKYAWGKRHIIMF